MPSRHTNVLDVRPPRQLSFHGKPIEHVVDAAGVWTPRAHVHASLFKQITCERLEAFVGNLARIYGNEGHERIDWMLKRQRRRIEVRNARDVQQTIGYIRRPPEQPSNDGA